MGHSLASCDRAASLFCVGSMAEAHPPCRRCGNNHDPEQTCEAFLGHPFPVLWNVLELRQSEQINQIPVGRMLRMEAVYGLGQHNYVVVFSYMVPRGGDPAAITYVIMEYMCAQDTMADAIAYINRGPR